MQPMIEFAEVFIWVFLATLFAYIPWVCYLDWKYREIKHSTWDLLATIGGLSLTFGFFAGIYEWWMLIPSFVAIVIYFTFMKLHYIEGADFVFIGLIALFFLYNPITGHWFPILAFSIFLTACVGVAGLFVLMWNWMHGKGISFEWDRGFPMMFPICAALIFTGVLF